MDGDCNLDVSIVTSIIEREVTIMRAIEKYRIISIELITMEMKYPKERHKLLGSTCINFLQGINFSGDEAKNGTCREEVITLIGDLVQYQNRTSRKNRWDYLFRTGKLN